MNHKEIVVGGIYFDGKAGVREVLQISGAPIDVRYRILAAKAETELDEHFERRSTIGKQDSCRLEYFSRWATAQYTSEGAQELLLALQVKKMKLPPGEAAFFRETVAACGVHRPGTMVAYDHTEGRAVTGLEKKGLLTRSAAGKAVELTHLGRSMLEFVTAASVQQTR